MPKFGEWTPISEGPPEKFEPVLVTRVEKFTAETTVDAGMYLGNGTWRCGGYAANVKVKNVIGWMPYPKGMEEKRNG